MVANLNTQMSNFAFFWASASPFSNWFKSPFEHNGVKYNCSEQYMMHMKALVFEDSEVANEILKEKDPRKQKAWGREVRSFEQATWEAVCQEIMVDGLLSKFRQNPYCLKALLNTGDKIIAEASPYDKVWGIGMTEDNPLATQPDKWLGKNLLGIVLMRVREILKNEQ
jgi:ribA/ribD-fused uncharacterized protein